MLPEEALFGRYPAAFYLLSTPLNVALDVAQHPLPVHRQPPRQHAVRAGLALRAAAAHHRPMARLAGAAGCPPALLPGPVDRLRRAAGCSNPGPLCSCCSPWRQRSRLDPDRRWIAVLLAAAATFFKDTAILFLAADLVADDDRMEGTASGRCASTRERRRRGHRSVPDYYLVRRGLHIVSRLRSCRLGRPVDAVAGVGEWLNDRAQSTGHRRDAQLSAAATLWCLCGMAVARREAWPHLVWSVTAIGARDLLRGRCRLAAVYRLRPVPRLSAPRGVRTAVSDDQSIFTRRSLLVGATVGIALLQGRTTVRVLVARFPSPTTNAIRWNGRRAWCGCRFARCPSV